MHRIQLHTHFAKGAIFENYVLAELLKIRSNHGLSPGMFYWKDNHNKEIDCIIETSSGPLACEIKSAATFSSSFFENIYYWNRLDPANKKAVIIYGGDKSFPAKEGQVVAWNDLSVLNIN